MEWSGDAVRLLDPIHITAASSLRLQQIAVRISNKAISKGEFWRNFKFLYTTEPPLPATSKIQNCMQIHAGKRSGLPSALAFLPRVTLSRFNAKPTHIVVVAICSRPSAAQKMQTQNLRGRVKRAREKIRALFESLWGAHACVRIIYSG